MVEYPKLKNVKQTNNMYIHNNNFIYIKFPDFYTLTPITRQALRLNHLPNT